MAGSWNANVNFIQDGERVDANVSGRPDRTLTDRTQYLKDRLDELVSGGAGQAIFAIDVAVDPAVAVGNPVYWHSANQRFEKALAVVEQTAEGALVNAPSAEVIGIVYEKTSSTVATLVTAGRIKIDLDAAVDGTVSAGRYYLSGLEPGKLIRQSSSVSVPVLYYDGVDTAYVQIQPKSLTETHNHLRVSLYSDPAGTINSPGIGERYTISSANATLQGWLPADHSSFNDLAPVGAAFGYNLATHPELSVNWPPIPESSAAIVIFGGQRSFGREMPVGDGGIAIIDRNGIWWMADCYGSAPWDIATSFDDALAEDIINTSSCSLPSSSEDIVLYFSKVRYAAGASNVSSLRTDSTSSPLVITDLDDNPAVSGDLKIKFDSNFLVSSTEDHVTSKALKSISGTTFTRGYVVGGIKAANDSVTLTSTNPRVAGGETIHQGVVTIETNFEGIERFILPQVVRLVDVKERYENDIMYLGMPASIASSVRYKFKLPSSGGMPASPILKLRLWLTGDATTSSFPTLTVSYRRLPKALTQATIPTSDTYLTLTTGMALTTDKYIEKTSASFSVAESDVVLFTISRSASDGYLGEIGILDAVAVLSPGA